MRIARQLIALLLVVWIPAISNAQNTTVKGSVRVKGSIGIGAPLSLGTGSFFAEFPQSGVNSGLTTGTGFCSPPGGTYDAIKTMKASGGDYTPTFAQLKQVKVDQIAANQWWLLKIDAGTNLHGSSFDANDALVTFSGSATVTKCLVIQSSTHNTDGEIPCVKDLPGFGGPENQTDLRNAQNCVWSGHNDASKFWKITVDSTPTSGFTALNCPAANGATPPCNYLLVEDVEITIAPGAFQSASQVKVIIQAEFDGDHVGLAYSWVHGWNPGDAGQPGIGSGNANVDNATGVCVGTGSAADMGWNKAGVVNTSGTTVTWVSGDQFGMDFADATHSVGWAQATSGQANQLVINGTGYTIASHDPGASSTTLTLSTSAGTQTGVNFTLQNPMTVYATGCGDDSRGIQMNCTNCFEGFNFFNKIHWYQNESHAVSGGFSAGPVKHFYVWAEAGSSGMFFGGAPTDTRGGPVNDVEGGNIYIGRDLNWKFLSAASGNSPAPPYGCGPLDGNSAHDTCSFNWGIKNNMELKVCNRCIFYGIMLDGTWADGQSGYLLLLNVRTASGGQTAGVYDTNGLPTTLVRNIRIENFWFRNCPQVVEMSTRSLSPGNGGGLSLPTKNLDFINGLVTNCGDSNQWGNPGRDFMQWSSSGQTFLATLSRTGGIAHAVVAPMKLTNADTGNNIGTFKTSMDVSGISRSGSTVTLELSNDRHDPTVGGSATLFVQDWKASTRFTNTKIKPTAGTNTGGFIFSTPATATTDRTGSSAPNWGTCQTTSSTCVDGDITWTNTGATSLGYEGTFTISSVQQGGGPGVPTAACSQDNFGNTVSAAVATQPQPCIRADGTFGDTIVYTSAGTAGTLCSSLALCNQTGMSVVMDTLAYKIANIDVGEGVYVHNCTGGSLGNPTLFEVGLGTFVPATSGTTPAGNDVFYANAGSNDSGVSCQLDNSAGWPARTSVQNVSLLSPEFLSINSNGLESQHYTNWFIHNLFAVTDAAATADIKCVDAGTEGTASFACWDLNTLQVFDNVLQGRLSSRWSVVPGGSPANFTDPTPATVTCSGATATTACLGFTGYMNGTAFPTAAATFNGVDPTNTPLMTAPWQSNFDLSKIVPVASSSYAAEGVNLTKLNAQFNATQYICPVGVTCSWSFPD